MQKKWKKNANNDFRLQWVPKIKIKSKIENLNEIFTKWHNRVHYKRATLILQRFIVYAGH